MEMLQKENRASYQKVFVKRSLLARLFHITQEIQRGTYPNVALLERILEVSRRTVNRCIEILRDDLNAPIAYSRKHRGYYFESPGPFHSSV